MKKSCSVMLYLIPVSLGVFAFLLILFILRQTGSLLAPGQDYYQNHFNSVLPNGVRLILSAELDLFCSRERVVFAELNSRVYTSTICLLFLNCFPQL